MAQAALVNIEIKDADKILQAASEEAMRWLDKLSKASPGRINHWKIAPSSKWPSVTAGLELVATIDQIDDRAEGYFNSQLLNFGDANKPIKVRVRVKNGPNALAVAIHNTGSFKWGARIDLRHPGSNEPYFHRQFTNEDAFVPGQGVNTHVLILPFPGA